MPSSSYSLQSAVMTCSGLSVSSGEPTEKISSANSAGSTPVICDSSSSTRRSVGVAVGELRLSVSESKPAMRSPAIARGTGTPACSITERDDRARGADGIVPEKNRRIGRNSADSMVVENFDDPHFVGALHRLRKLVVIDEDQLARGPFEKIALRQNADQHAGLIDNRKDKRRRMRRLLPHVLEQSVRRKSQVFRFQHASDLHRAARQVHADGGVVGRADDRDAARAGRA